MKQLRMKFAYSKLENYIETVFGYILKMGSNLKPNQNLIFIANILNRIVSTISNLDFRNQRYTFQNQYLQKI